MNPKTYNERRVKEERLKAYRANVRKYTSILKHLMRTGLAKTVEINRAYCNLANVDWKKKPSSRELNGHSTFV
jgi:hypothetical protein